MASEHSDILVEPRGESEPRPRPKIRRSWVIMAVALLTLVIVRELTGSKELTSSFTFAAALGLAVPILFAGLGGLWSERVGVVNIGLEGMMILGTWFGAWAGWKFGPWYGVLFGMAGGAAGGLLHAVATITFGVDQIVSGVAINILAAGIARFLSVITYTIDTGGSAAQSPQVTGTLFHFTMPVLAGGPFLGIQKTPDVLGWFERKHWFLISDVAGVTKGLMFDLSALTLIAVALIPFSYWWFWRTRTGLRMRSVGENPIAADSLGVRVYLMKYIGVVISGVLAGLGGVFLVFEAGIYHEGQTGGRGFIGLAALIFGNWRPGGIGVAAGLFGYADSLQLRSDPAIHALLLFVAMALAIAAVWFIGRKRAVPGAALVILSSGFFMWWATSQSVPGQLVGTVPYIATLVVLSVASQRLRPPTWDGRPYRKGQAQ